jgi:hypothetical protein
MRYAFHISAILYFLAGIQLSKGQDYGNEWIHQDQEYFKIQVIQTGIYHITYSDLSVAGVLSENPDPRYFQLFHRGEEVSIQVAGEEDGSFDPSDYIEFYGVRNDGAGDIPLYEPNTQPHPYYSLFSDSSSYFLSWNLVNIPGKRIQNFTQTENTDNLSPENYHLEKILELKHTQFSDGLLYPSYEENPEVKKASFDFGEGWTGNAVTRGNQYMDTILNINQTFQSGPLPRFEILLAGRNIRTHDVTIEAGPSGSNLRIIGNFQFERHYNYRFNADLTWADIGADGHLFIRITPNGVDGAADRISISFISVVFPQLFETGSQTFKEFHLVENPANSSYIEISGILNPGTLWDITQPHNPVNIVYPLPQTTLNTLIPNTVNPRTLIYSEEKLSVPGIRKIDFRSINPAQNDYLIVYHRDFISQAGAYANPVQAYVDYRRSTGFNPLAMEISQLYDQFNYGEISPLAIRNFCRYMLDMGNPEYLLLLGKGLTVNHNYYRHRNDPEFDEFKDWVPTAGNPGSDVLFTSGLHGSAYGPAIPTGRVAAKSAQEVANYLDKVKETESFQFDGLWKKDVIQLSGGIAPGEPEIYRYYIDQFKLVEENLYFGGNVTNISKETTESVEFINITEEVNQGKSLILFFGHSGTLGSDIDIGQASDPRLGYNNRSKYPFIYMNGCDAGNVFTPVKSFGEDWIITGEKGAIAFSAHADVGYPRELRRYTDDFLATGYGDSAYIHQPLGNIFKISAEKYLSRYLVLEEKYIAQVQQTILQGDPYIRLFGADKPDYSIHVDEISAQSLEGKPVTTLADSFEIVIPVKNFGRADPRPFYISIKRTFPDQSTEVQNPVQYQPVYYEDTLYFRIKNDPAKSFGLNTFEIEVDPFDSIPELSKMNNRAVLDLIINKAGTQNIFPYNYSIVNTDSIRLVSQASGITESTRQFQFELDTTSQFNSVEFKEASFTEKFISEWNLNALQNNPKEDSLVFFWRTHFNDPLPGEDDSWSSFSFTYIENGPEGWIQRHPDQLLENDHQSMNYDPVSGLWNFNTYKSNIEVITFGVNHPEKDYEDIILRINESAYIFNTRLCTNNSLNAVSFDQVTTDPYRVLDFDVLYDILDRRTCGRQPQVINNILNNEITGIRDYLRRYIDAVKEGDPVLIFSIGQVNYDTWRQEIKDKVLEIGVSPAVIDGLANGDPLIILGKKGADEGSATVITADPDTGVPTDEQEISLRNEITGQATSAYMRTGRIGPAVSWQHFYNSVMMGGSPGMPHYHFSITGIRTDNTETILFDHVQDPSLDLSGIDPQAYPYLRLRFFTSDTSFLKPAQLKSWMVSFTATPEGILLPREDQSLTGNTVQEGEEYHAAFRFMNISNRDFLDSLQVFFAFTGQETTLKYTDSTRIGGPAARDQSDFEIHFPTLDYPGTQDLDLFANPMIVPEQSYINNRLILPGILTVKPDRIHPTVDVAFDGRYILDGDIVSPSPLISVILKDENKILLKKDTAGITLALRRPGEDVFERIAFSDPNLVWSPATDKNDFSIDYQPPPLADGIYTLSVQAEDASGNTSGTEPYEIRFEVINESQITHFYPFPNPFSTSTRFVFTLTGSIIPDELKIQIMTVSGKVVREILSDEIGPIHIGNNITEYAWDGRDEFGDQLANGVYLYRVIINQPGDNFKHRETAGDRGFNHDFGKLYLLR